ncbi:unnamed protein product [marine sediment metagenome]|uniref:Uncharacterized protein n=1 Tax=marine sediment metagenome TaxID=412755 RepID=X1BJH2_9ZZZZ
MQSEILTIGVQVGLFSITSLLGILFYRREKRAILASIDERIQGAIDGVGEALNEVFAKPVVKGAMTNLGKMGGAAMQNKSLMNKMAMDVLSGPKLQGLKMIAKQALNIDVDEYIEENGPIATLQAAQGIGDLVGIDVMAVLSGSLNGANLSVGAESDNPYLVRR